MADWEELERECVKTKRRLTIRYFLDMDNADLVNFINNPHHPLNQRLKDYSFLFWLTLFYRCLFIL